MALKVSNKILSLWYYYDIICKISVYTQTINIQIRLSKECYLNISDLGKILYTNRPKIIIINTGLIQLI